MMIPAVTYSLLMFVTGAGFGWWTSRKRKAVSADDPVRKTA
jgi:hypothetical protein